MVPTQLTVGRPKYTCLCKEGFYIPNETLQGFASDKVENEAYASNFSCLRCPGECFLCDKDGLCIHGPEEPDDFLTESVLRVSIGAIIGACMICCFLFALTVFRQRKCKVRARNFYFCHLIKFFFLFPTFAHADDSNGHVDYFRDYFTWNFPALLSGKHYIFQRNRSFIVYV